MAFYAYILKCADGKYYTGHTDDLEKRIGQHRSGLIKGFTSSRLPVTLMWVQEFPSRYEALDAELKIKSWSQAKKEALMREDWDGISFFAKPPSKRGAMPHGVSTGLDTNGKEENGAEVSLKPSCYLPFVSSAVETLPVHVKPTGVLTKLDANGIRNTSSTSSFVSSIVETPLSPAQPISPKPPAPE